MKNLEVALCDSCSDYILKFATYLLEHSKVGVHIFTTPEGFYSDDNDYDIALIAEEFEEVIGFRPKGVIKNKYILCENREDEIENIIFKYQSVDKILNKISLLKEAKASIKKSSGTSKLVGVYSPANHELQLPFSMALGQSYRTNGNVLFLDLEELSIMPELIGDGEMNNIMDLLYEINTNAETDISKYVRSFLGFDYVEPFLNPNEISEIDEDTWEMLFNALGKSHYDVVVILFGRTINGFTKYLEFLDRLYVLGKPGDYYRKSQEKFFDYLERAESKVDVEEVILPMSATNLADGTYQIEELLQGNLGMFVKKLINTNGR